jgi:hypothetical protein
MNECKFNEYVKVERPWGILYIDLQYLRDKVNSATWLRDVYGDMGDLEISNLLIISEDEVLPIPQQSYEIRVPEMTPEILLGSQGEFGITDDIFVVRGEGEGK